MHIAHLFSLACLLSTCYSLETGDTSEPRSSLCSREARALVGEARSEQAHVKTSRTVQRLVKL